MATTTTSEILSSVTSAAAEATASGDRAPSQGGVIEGSNPSEYNPKEPIVLFIIQVSSLPHWGTSQLRFSRLLTRAVG